MQANFCVYVYIRQNWSKFDLPQLRLVKKKTLFILCTSVVYTYRITISRCTRETTVPKVRLLSSKERMPSTDRTPPITHYSHYHGDTRCSKINIACLLYRVFVKLWNLMENIWLNSRIHFDGIFTLKTYQNSTFF